MVGTQGVYGGAQTQILKSFTKMTRIFSYLLLNYLHDETRRLTQKFHAGTSCTDLVFSLNNMYAAKLETKLIFFVVEISTQDLLFIDTQPRVFTFCLRK